jgi:S-adenosylmethionine:tRNA ribosyltransferase-isomerase
MDLSAFDYHLPEALIAQEPLADRAGSRMLVLYRTEQRWDDRGFREFPSFLGPGDCLVLNDSRVFPARLFGHRAGVHSLPIGKRNPKRHEHLTGEVEVLLLRALNANHTEWDALVHPGRKMRTGERIRFGDGLEAEIVARGVLGERTIRFLTDADPFPQLEKLGHVPLPPYIKRSDRPEDRERYQTVFAREAGSVAAPTAGLHFTPETLAACLARDATIAYLTLHVGLGTFQPLRAAQVETARLHSEHYEITAGEAAKMSGARRLVMAGTTSVRTMETALARGRLEAQQGETDIFIYPGFQFRGTGALLTNFHLPRSSLLLLVCAFAGTDLTLAAYRHAVAERYRFYSYGDCMLIL